MYTVLECDAQLGLACVPLVALGLQGTRGQNSIPIILSRGLLRLGSPFFLHGTFMAILFRAKMLVQRMLLTLARAFLDMLHLVSLPANAAQQECLSLVYYTAVVGSIARYFSATKSNRYVSHSPSSKARDHDRHDYNAVAQPYSNYPKMVCLCASRQDPRGTKRDLDP